MPTHKESAKKNWFSWMVPRKCLTSKSSTSAREPERRSDGPPAIHTGAGRTSPTSRSDAFQNSSIKLPSQVEDTLSVLCPRFRLVLVGNVSYPIYTLSDVLKMIQTGVGKSSLVSSVFNVDFNGPETDIDIIYDRIGKADISREYRSDQNPRLILHDSMVFEPGSTEKAEVLKSFLQSRAEGNAELSEQVHAIWLCIETPRTGSRLLQTADEDFLEFAKELKIPVIVVFTKYDYLVVEHFRACNWKLPLPERKAEAIDRAERVFKDFTKELKVPFAPVSTQREEQKSYGGTMVVNLIKVTLDNLRHSLRDWFRYCLPDSLRDSLTENPHDSLRDVTSSFNSWAIWATTQQANAHQKVELSIRWVVFQDKYALELCHKSDSLVKVSRAKYWRNLGQSDFFQGRRLVDCIAHIHDDVLKIWNFDDPLKLLSGEGFLEGMLRLVEPFSDGVIQVRNQLRAERPRANDIVNMVAVTSAVGSGLVIPAQATTLAIQNFQPEFLDCQYQKGVSTAIYLAAYIIDLILVLHEITMVGTLNPSTSLSPDVVMDALATYKLRRSCDIHAQVRGVAYTFKLEEKIPTIIRDALPPLRM